MNTIEIPLTFATAGLVGLGGLAFLMGAVLSLIAELLAILRGHRNWARSDAKPRPAPPCDTTYSADLRRATW